MKKLDDYMQDPSVAREPMPLREVHAIRMMIYDETKDMTPDELRTYHERNMDEAKRLYNIQFVPSARQA